MLDSRTPTLAEQQQFWDWHWKQWQERKTVNEWKQKRHETILNLLRSLSLDRPRILDLGCGPGWYTEQLAQFGATTGIDLSDEAIRMAQSRFPHITFFVGNLYDFPLPGGHFEVVVSQEVFDHVQDQSAFLDRAAHLLRPGGYLILSCTNKFVMDRLGDEQFPRQPSGHIAHYLNMRNFKHLLRRRFRIVSTTTVLPMGHGGILRLINSHKMNTILELVSSRQSLRRLKERAGFGYQLVAVAQIRE